MYNTSHIVAIHPVFCSVDVGIGTQLKNLAQFGHGVRCIGAMESCYSRLKSHELSLNSKKLLHKGLVMGSLCLGTMTNQLSTSVDMRYRVKCTMV